MAENKVVRLKADFSKMHALLDDLTEAVSASRPTDAFMEILIDLVDASLFKKLFGLQSISVDTTEILVVAIPTDLSEAILTAVRAGDFDLSVFEV